MQWYADCDSLRLCSHISSLALSYSLANIPPAVFRLLAHSLNNISLRLELLGGYFEPDVGLPGPSRPGISGLLLHR